MKNILILADRSVATDYYRATGPFAKIAKSGLINILNPHQHDWRSQLMCDVFFIQRPWTTKHFEMISQAKLMNIPIWVDWDDSPFDVPVSNPCYSDFMNSSVKKTIIQCLLLADEVTVSTDHLNQRLKQLLDLNKQPGKPITTIPNAWDLDRFPFCEIGKSSVIVWRGSSTHHEDVVLYTKAMVNFVKDNPDWQWRIMGDPLWFFSTQLDSNSLQYYKPLGMFEYLATLKSFSPKAMFVPLVKSDFNKSKSNIAWLEATYAGAVTVASDLPEFNQPGVINFSTEDEAKWSLANVASKDFDSKYHLESSRAAVVEKFSLSFVNQKRIQILERICN